MSNRRQFPHLKESQLRSLGTPAALEAGRRAWQSGCVAQTMLSAREPMLLGSVQDEAGRLCHVSVRHFAGDEFGPLCDCAGVGFCAHAMALLLAWAHDSHEFTPALPPPRAEPEESGVRRQWSEHLRSSSLNQLRAIARRHELPLHGGEREPATAQLLDVLADPGHATLASAELNDSERRLLQMVYMLSDGSAGVSSAELQEALGWPSASPADEELRGLRDAGLVISFSAPGQSIELFALAPGVTVSAAGLLDLSEVEMVDRFQSKPDPAGEFVGAGLAPTRGRGQPSPPAGVRDHRRRSGHRVAPTNDNSAAVCNLATLRVSGNETCLAELLLLSRHMQLSPRPAPPEPAQAQSVAALRRWPCLVSELVRLQVKPGWAHQADSTLTVPVPEPWLDDGSLVRMRALTPDDTLNDFVAHLAEHRRKILRVSTGEGHRTDTLPEVYAAWQSLASWTELWPAQQRADLCVRRSVTATTLTYAGWMQQLARARRFITRLLSLLRAETWFDFGSLLATIQEIRPSFLHEHDDGAADAPGWWLEPCGKAVAEAETWQANHGAFVAEVLRGPLAWLGVVELAFGLDAGAGGEPAPLDSSAVIAFRLTRLGLALLRGEELPAGRTEEPLLLLADLSAHVRLGRHNLDAYWLLERIARFERVQDHEAIYRFDIHSAHAAFARGYTGDDIVGELERLTAAMAPDAARNQWLTWWQSYSQTRWYEGLTLIELADDYILQELLTQTDLREHLLFTFGPRLVAVRSDSADAFARQLVRKGYTPRIE